MQTQLPTDEAVAQIGELRRPVNTRRTQSCESSRHDTLDVRTIWPQEVRYDDGSMGKPLCSALLQIGLSTLSCLPPNLPCFAPPLCCCPSSRGDQGKYTHTKYIIINRNHLALTRSVVHGCVYPSAVPAPFAVPAPLEKERNLRQLTLHETMTRDSYTA